MITTFNSFPVLLDKAKTPTFAPKSRKKHPAYLVAHRALSPSLYLLQSHGLAICSLSATCTRAVPSTWYLSSPFPLPTQFLSLLQSSGQAWLPKGLHYKVKALVTST